MTLSEYERRLKAVNPKLHIKRVASGKGGIHLGSQFICRIDTGELTLYNQWKWDEGESQQMATQLNPTGWHKYQRLLKRGRAETARILYTRRVIRMPDIAKLT